MIQFLHMKRYQDTKQTRPLMQAKTNNVECLQYVQSHHMMQSTFFVLKIRSMYLIVGWQPRINAAQLHLCITGKTICG